MLNMTVFRYFITLFFLTQINAQQSVLRDQSNVPLHDLAMVDQSSIPGFNASTVPPQDAATLERLHTWIKPSKYEGDGSELEKHASSHLEGTSQWLFDSPVFQQWHGARDHGILWIRGVPATEEIIVKTMDAPPCQPLEIPVVSEVSLAEWLGYIKPSDQSLEGRTLSSSSTISPLVATALWSRDLVAVSFGLLLLLGILALGSRSSDRSKLWMVCLPLMSL